MKAWEVLGVVHDGELICEDCLVSTKEINAFYDRGEPDNKYTPLFVSDANGDETCTRCGQLLSECV
jgi:hypothetical protein